jgi:cyclic-di-GMP phosphodiesterase TipF (flagellum assembly factor)
MGRLSAVFIAFCMIVVAGAVGAVAYLSFDISGMEAFVIATAAMTVMVLINSTNGRTRDRSDAGAHIADLSRGTVDLARKVSEIERRLIALEGDVAVTLDEARTIASPLNEEIGELGSLVKDLADAVAAHDQMLDSALVSAPPARPAPAPASPLPPPSSERLFVTEPIDRGADLTEPETAPQPTAARTSNGPFRGLDQAEINARLARAVEANRIELFLQPIVTLPQRKVRYYEAQTRLRGDDGGLIATEDFYPHAAAAQLLPAIDNLMVFRCVQVVRRLSTKNREVGLFCALSADTFAHAKLFKDLTDFLEANRAIAPHLVFQFTQEALRGLGPIEEECVASLADLGFRFAICPSAASASSRCRRRSCSAAPPPRTATSTRPTSPTCSPASASS